MLKNPFDPFHSPPARKKISDPHIRKQPGSDCMLTFPSATSCWRLLLRGGFKRFLPTYEAICYRSNSNSPSLTSKELRSIWCALFRSESRTVKLWKSVYNVAGAYGLPRQGMESAAVVAPRGWHWVTRTLPYIVWYKRGFACDDGISPSLRTNERTGNGYLGSNFTICTGTANVCMCVLVAVLLLPLPHAGLDRSFWSRSIRSI